MATERAQEVEHALRIVLVIAFSRDEASLLVAGPDTRDPVSLWPSTIYGWLTRQMLTSRASWLRGAARLDRRLSPWLERFQGRSPMDLAQTLAEGREAWSVQELAALLWALLRREQPALDTLLRRLAAETEIAIFQMTMRPPDRASTGPREGCPSTSRPLGLCPAC